MTSKDLVDILIISICLLVIVLPIATVITYILERIIHE